MRKSIRDYYYEKIDGNVFYPITKKNLHKLNKFVITVDGLKYFNELRRKFIRDDSSLTLTELANLGQLWLHYAATNRNPQEVTEWDNYIFRVANKVDLLHEKITLRKNGFIIPNKEYDPKQMEYHRIWTNVILQKMKERDPTDPTSYCDKCGQIVEDDFWGYSNDDDLHYCFKCDKKMRK